MIVTSFSQKGYHDYGRDFITTFLKHWPDEELTVYFEKGIPSNKPESDRVTYKDLYQFDDFAALEQVLLKSDPLYTGKHRSPEGKPVYNFRYDANRFFRKVFCIYDTCNERACTGLGRVAWIDADVYFTKDVPSGFLETLLPDGNYVAHLGREWLYTEAGFIVFDTTHQANAVFMQLFYNAYFTGAFKYLGEFHDCYVFDFLRNVLMVPAINLTTNEMSDHPFQESVLGEYMVHMKGPERKQRKGLLDTDRSVA